MEKNNYKISIQFPLQVHINESQRQLLISFDLEKTRQQINKHFDNFTNSKFAMIKIGEK